MRKIFFIILSVLTIQLFGQSGDKSQSIELPDFVITGIQSVSLPTINKKKTEFIKVIDSDFLTPKYNSEQFALMDNTAPIKKQMKLYSSVKRYNGLLKIGAGLQTIPIGSFDYGFNKHNFLFNAHIKGDNVREYIPYAGYNSSGAKINLDYFTPHNSYTFPGLKISASGRFFRDLYNFYGTANQKRQRENSSYEGDFSLSNTLSKKLMYGMELSGNYLDMKQEGVKENLLQGKGFAEFGVGAFAVGGSAFYKVGKVNSTTAYSRYDYLSGKIYLNFNSSDVFNLKIGANYSKLDSTQIFSPIALISIFVEKGAALFISYEGGGKLYTLSNMLTENRYFELSNNYILENNIYKIKVAIKYDFEDVFDLNAGFYSGKYDNFHYYEDLGKDNKFNLITADEVEGIGAFFNLILHGKKFGDLSMVFNFRNIQDSSGNKIPYQPLFDGNVSYGIDFWKKIYSKITLNYYASTYYDLANSAKLPEYINLELLLKYKIFKPLALSLNLQNLLNRENYLFKGYQEKPLDVIIGVEYSW